MESDEDLMLKSQRGDNQAFGVLYDRYVSRMIGYFYKMLWNDREKAEDMTQDLFAKIIKSGSSFDRKKSFKTWIFSIASNMCKNEYRHEEVKRKHMDSQKSVNQSYDSEPSIDAANFKLKLDEQLSELDTVKRSVFIMRFKQNLSIKEIAEVMECSEGTIKSRIFYTLKELAAQLKEFDPKRTI
jgi:RNA polymerase sigma-70 factor (ECF subfamily)